jgi:hypothetical protein
MEPVPEANHLQYLCLSIVPDYEGPDWLDTFQEQCTRMNLQWANDVRTLAVAAPVEHQFLLQRMAQQCTCLSTLIVDLDREDMEFILPDQCQWPNLQHLILYGRDEEVDDTMMTRVFLDACPRLRQIGCYSVLLPPETEELLISKSFDINENEEGMMIATKL